MTDRILLAEIGPAHGIRGEVLLRVHASDPGLLRDLPLTSEDGRAFRVTALRPAKAGFVARLQGVTDRNAAEALRGTRLFADRGRLPPPQEDEFYHADLIGLAAEDAAGAPLGRIVAVHDFGAGDLLEVQPESGRSVLVPFTKTVVPVVDVAAGRVVVDPPAGLFGGTGDGPAAGEDVS